MKIWDDYDDCIIGVGTRSGMVDVFVYDKHRMIANWLKGTICLMMKLKNL